MMEGFSETITNLESLLCLCILSLRCLALWKRPRSLSASLTLGSVKLAPSWFTKTSSLKKATTSMDEWHLDSMSLCKSHSWIHENEEACLKVASKHQHNKSFDCLPGISGIGRFKLHLCQRFSGKTDICNGFW